MTEFAVMLTSDIGAPPRYLVGDRPGCYLWVYPEAPNYPRRFPTREEALAVCRAWQSTDVVPYPDVLETFFLLTCSACAFCSRSDGASAIGIYTEMRLHEDVCPLKGKVTFALRREVLDKLCSCGCQRLSDGTISTSDGSVTHSAAACPPGVGRTALRSSDCGGHPMNSTRMAAEMLHGVLSVFRDVAAHALKANDIRTDAFAMIATELERVRESEDSMAAMLKRLEWARDGACAGHWCAVCHREEGAGHAMDCALDAALRPFR